MPALAYRSTMPRPGDVAIIAIVTEAVEQGHPLTTAATKAGISEATARQWYAEGLAQLDAGDELGSHVRFAQGIRDAQARFVDGNLAIVHRDMATPGKGWLPAMTLLERRMPQHFGRQNRLDVSVEQRSVNVNIELSGPAAEAMALLIAERRPLQLPEPST